MNRDQDEFDTLDFSLIVKGKIFRSGSLRLVEEIAA